MAMIRIYLIGILIVINLYSQALSAQLIPLQYKQNKSFTYDETIGYYQLLDKTYKHGFLLEKGLTDVGKPLHLFVMYGGRDFYKDVIEKHSVPVLFIMNGIHPGEPDGIDASLLLSEWILSKADSLIQNVCICIIPVYNVDGSLNRSCCSRANQDGPEMYGFRGNAQNLDLNRDFIKLDSRNSQSFVEIFQWIKPDLFIDTHVSNGADYQYTFTLLTSQQNKMEPLISRYLYGTILPRAELYMNNQGWPVAPYVFSKHEIPDSGLVAFYDSPRYSTGYAALFSVPGFVVETHMLKPFASRVEATLEFLKFATRFMFTSGKELKATREASLLNITTQNCFGLNWKLNEKKTSTIPFLGYEASYKPSLVTGQNRLFYDTQKPYQKNIPMCWYYECVDSCTKPFSYIIPQAWKPVIDKLKMNGVSMSTIQRDTSLTVSTYKILSYQSSSQPYEGHHMKRNVKVEPVTVKQSFFKGDVVVQTGGIFDYFLASVLEPTAHDSYFSWGFFDGVLQQKEWFSDYVWEDKAWELLKNNEQLRLDFEQRKASDTAFAKNSWDQLYFIYRNSPYFEEKYMQYPVYKLP